MLTYLIWKNVIEINIRFHNDFDAISEYAWTAFGSIFTIVFDILTTPFQLIGIIIWLITRRIKDVKNT